MLRELTQAWSASNDRLWDMPDEVLGLCFAFLPFSSRIAVSHVSRRWRTIALAHPAIWADMYFSLLSNQDQLLHLALPRTGCHPVDLICLIDEDPGEMVEKGLLQHAHHLRTVAGCVPDEELSLEGIDEGCDVTPHYIDWRTDNHRRVLLHQDAPTTAHLGTLFNGARELVVREERDADQVEISAHGPALRTSSINFKKDADITNIAELLLSATSCLQRVSELEIPLFALKTFLPVLTALPILEYFTISISAQYARADGKYTHSFDWHLPRDLPTLSERCLSLTTICLVPRCVSNRCPPSTQDARDLLTRLAEFVGLELPDIEIEGFSPGLLCSSEIPRPKTYYIVSR
ncbi:hypothetical protein AURDEDRAFT_166615 [Auricularia subglabra TFB-10046 SS5]|nr:hypothetical protein AURDEDRAFT_166615 [Auricularia subglabra TFB-10046 SS5]